MGELHEKVMSKAVMAKKDIKTYERKKPTPVFVPRMGPNYDDDSDRENQNRIPETPVYKSHWR